MRDVSKFKLMCSSFCRQYGRQFYVDEAHSSGVRQLVVIYASGGYGGNPEFVTGIPNSWTEDDIINLERLKAERLAREAANSKKD